MIIKIRYARVAMKKVYKLSTEIVCRDIQCWDFIIPELKSTHKKVIQDIKINKTFMFLWVSFAFRAHYQSLTLSPLMTMKGRKWKSFQRSCACVCVCVCVCNAITIIILKKGSQKNSCATLIIMENKRKIT